MQLPHPFDEICAAEIALKNDDAVFLSRSAVLTLFEIADAGELVRALRLQMDAWQSLPVENDVRWALEENSEHDTVLLAVSSAIRHGMSKEVDAALDHKFSHAVAMALSSIASSLAAPLPKRLLALADNRGSPVRLALVDALATRIHPSYKQTFIRLAKDQWCKVEMYPEGEYPIARS